MDPRTTPAGPEYYTAVSLKLILRPATIIAATRVAPHLKRDAHEAADGARDLIY